MRVMVLVMTLVTAVLAGGTVAAETAASDDSLAAAVQPYVERGELAGAVMLVADAEGVLAATAVGAANIEHGQAMTPENVFWIASQSKPITAAAVMMLVDEEKIRLDDPVERYLPEFRGQMVVAEKSEERVLLEKAVHPITVREVLSHTSGLPFRSGIEVPTLDRLPLADRVRSYAMTPLEFQPGTAYQYSNAGINTAARILEVVAEQPFEEFVEERLLRPLQMHDTTFWPTEEQVTRIATSYRPGKDGEGLEATQIDQLQYPLSDRGQRTPMPAGGLFSTATDVARFYRMLANQGSLDGQRYLTPEAVQTLTSKQTPDAVATEYGLGFSTGGNRFGHGGAYATNSFLDRSNGLILIWLVQHAGFPGEGTQAQGAFHRAAQQFADPTATP